MSESKGSQNFIKYSKSLLGRKLWIKKVIDPLEKGVPDIQAVYLGMPVFLESKLIHSISRASTHKFEKIQVEQLEERAKSGAMAFGLLICEREYRYINWNEIPKNGIITKEQYENAEVFNWDSVRLKWLQMVNSL